MEKENLVIYAYDSEADGTVCGPGTKKRCDRGLDLVLMGDHESHDWTIYLGAGIDPYHPKSPPLKQAMFDYLKRQLLSRGYRSKAKVDGYRFGFSNDTAYVEIVLAKMDAWGTFRETEAVVAELHRGKRSGKVYVVSSSFHISRIRFIWRFMRGFHPKIAWVHHEATFQEKILEKVKLIKVLLLGTLRTIGF